MRLRITGFASGLLFALMVLPCGAAQGARSVVTVGVLAYLGAERGLTEWEQTRAAWPRR